MTNMKEAKRLCKLAALKKILVWYNGKQYWVGRKWLKTAKKGYIYFEDLKELIN